MDVLVVDDHPMVLEYLPAVIRKEFGDVSVRSAKALEDALHIAGSNERLDLVILDLGLPGCSGTDTLRRFCARRPGVPVVVFSSDDRPETITGCLELGAAGYIPKTSPPPVIAAALRLVSAGGTYTPPLTPTEQGKAPTMPRLSAREQQVLDQLVKGYSNARIAEELGIAEATVKQHVTGVFAAFHVHSRAELMVAASRLGLLA